MSETFPGVILWVYDDLERGGCLSDLSGETYLYMPVDDRQRGRIRNKVYASGFFPEPGRTVNFSIEWGAEFGYCGYRVTSLGPLTESDAIPEEWAALKQIWTKFEEAEALKKAYGPRTRAYARR